MYFAVTSTLVSKKNFDPGFQFRYLDDCAELCYRQEDLRAYQRMASQVPKTKGHKEKREWRMVEMCSNRLFIRGQFLSSQNTDRLWSV